MLITTVPIVWAVIEDAVVAVWVTGLEIRRGSRHGKGYNHVNGRGPTTRELERRPVATAERRNAEGATWREPMRALRVVGVAEARTPVMETVMAAIFSVRRLGRDEEWVFSRLRVHECAPPRVGDGLSGAVGRVEFPDRDFFRSRSIFILEIGGEPSRRAATWQPRCTSLDLPPLAGLTLMAATHLPVHSFVLRCFVFDTPRNRETPRGVLPTLRARSLCTMSAGLTSVP